MGQINWHIFTHKHKLATPGNKENIWKNTRVLLFAISGRGDAFLGSFHKYGQHVAQLNCQLEAGESQEREGGSFKVQFVGQPPEVDLYTGQRMYMSIYTYIVGAAVYPTR